jgi:hypothetical protein
MWFCYITLLHEAVINSSLIRKVQELRACGKFIFLTYWQVFMIVEAILYVLVSRPKLAVCVEFQTQWLTK